MLESNDFNAIEVLCSLYGEEGSGLDSFRTLDRLWRLADRCYLELGEAEREAIRRAIDRLGCGLRLQ